MIKKTDREDLRDLYQAPQHKEEEAHQADEKHSLREGESSSNRLKRPIKVSKVSKE